MAHFQFWLKFETQTPTVKVAYLAVYHFLGPTCSWEGFWNADDSSFAIFFPAQIDLCSSGPDVKKLTFGRLRNRGKWHRERVWRHKLQQEENDSWFLIPGNFQQTLSLLTLMKKIRQSGSRIKLDGRLQDNTVNKFWRLQENLAFGCECGLGVFNVFWIWNIEN